jgi:hypothetical protein
VPPAPPDAPEPDDEARRRKPRFRDVPDPEMAARLHWQPQKVDGPGVPALSWPDPTTLA